MGHHTLVFLFLLLAPPVAWSAACCGGGASLPSLITSDYRSQFNMSFTNSAITHEANSKGEITARDGSHQEVLETFSFAAAHQINSYWQLGFTLPVSQSTKVGLNNQEASTGFGDLKLMLAYEFLPELSYSPWKPRGFVFVEESLPLSASIYNSSKALSTDALSQGNYTTSIGFSFVKVKNPYDFNFTLETHNGFIRSYEQQGKNFRVQPGGGYTLALSAGLSPGASPYRLGIGLLKSYENPKILFGDINSLGDAKSYLSGNFSYSYLFSKFSMTLTYSDQSFFSQAESLNLSKSISLSLLSFIDL